MNNYDLVTIRRYNGVRDGMHEWMTLSCAIVIKLDSIHAVCMRDENVGYTYLPQISINSHTGYNHENVKQGDIHIFPIEMESFTSIKKKNRASMERFMTQSDLYFDDDTIYGTRIIKDEPQKRKSIFRRNK